MRAELYRKGWLETRSRFVTAVVVTIAVCAFWTLGHGWVNQQWHRDLIQHPEWDNPPWFMRAMKDYPFFIWHFVYAEMFQKIWVIFAVLLGIGGLSREAAYGTAGFTLALPVSRLALFRARASVAVAELLILNLTAVLTIGLCSRVTGLSYPVLHGVSYNALMFAGGIVFLSGSLCLTEFVEGEYTPALIGLGSVGLLYFVMQPYADGIPVTGLAIPFAIPRLMAGSGNVGNIGVQWLGMAASLTAAAGFTVLARYRILTRDF